MRGLHARSTLCDASSRRGTEPNSDRNPYPMPMFVLGHPSSDALSAFTEADSSPDNPRVAAHVADCAECRERVQLFQAVRSAARGASVPPLPATLRERVLQSRASRVRVDLPIDGASIFKSSRRWIPVAVAAAAAALVAVLGEGVLSSNQEADAGSTSGTMTIAPALPRPGQAVHITYDAPPTLARFKTLVVRARLRSINSDAYESGVPVRTIAILTRTKGNSYASSVTLPDSIVFAALAVEDSAGTIIDDHEKRTWELLATIDGQQPSFAALYQRANDMMGRNFEEGHATARRMAQLYPDSLAGWSYLHSFDLWMGVGQADSVLAVHRAVLHRLERPWRTSDVVPDRTLGFLAWYAQSLDTSAATYWRSRLLREAPHDGFAIQWRLVAGFQKLHVDGDTAATFRLLDSLWEQRTPERAGQVASQALGFAIATRRPAVIDRWWTRLLSVSNDSVQAEVSFGEELSQVRPLAHLGIERLRNIIPKVSQEARANRRLTETAAMRDRRATRLHRRVLSSMGQAMVASGAMSSGLDTLMLAAQSGWDLSIFRAIRTASLATGDSATALSMTARLLADPSTTQRTRDSLGALALKAVGPLRWTALQQNGTRLFAQRMLEESTRQSIPGKARLRTADGRKVLLSDRVRGRVTVIAFWSRYCGWALDDLDNLKMVAQRLQGVGSQMIVVLDDEPGPSAGLSAFLKEHDMRLPVQFDVEGSTSKALNNWGTPHYYVLDETGKVRFAAVNLATDALVRAEAVRNR